MQLFDIQLNNDYHLPGNPSYSHSHPVARRTLFALPPCTLCSFTLKPIMRTMLQESMNSMSCIAWLEVGLWEVRCKLNVRWRKEIVKYGRLYLKWMMMMLEIWHWVLGTKCIWKNSYIERNECLHFMPEEKANNDIELVTLFYLATNSDNRRSPHEAPHALFHAHSKLCSRNNTAPSVLTVPVIPGQPWQSHPKNGYEGCPTWQSNCQHSFYTPK